MARRHERFICGCGFADIIEKANAREDLPECDRQTARDNPYGHPDGPYACRDLVLNPYWPPFGAAGEYVSANGAPDVPITKSIGDHVPPE